MKSIYKLPVFILFSIFFSLSSKAQSSLGMTYQAVVRNASNALVANAVVGVRVSIIQGTPTGTVAYVETHLPTTNINGLATFNIGTGTATVSSYFLIDWANGPYFLKTDIDPTGGVNYTITNTAQFMSVPYAQFAYKSADSGWGLVGNNAFEGNFIGTTNNSDLIFKRNNVKAGLITNTGQNTAFGLNSLASATTAQNNTAVGSGALLTNLAGFNNTGLGTNALRNTTGSLNTAVGVASAFANTTGGSNTSVGHFSLKTNIVGDGNVSLGNNSLENSVGFFNTAVGFQSLIATTGDQNTAIGWRSLETLTTGGGNIAIGKISNVPSPTTNNQLSIGNVIYGTNMGSTATGTIGIGVPVPTEKLEVGGKTKTVNLQVTTGAGDNRILTSDAVGNAIWEAPANFNSGLESRMTVTQSIPNDTPTKLIFSTESTDDANAHNVTTGNWTIPSSGFYHIYATLGFNDIINAGTYVRMIVYKNGIVWRTSTSVLGFTSVFNKFDIAVDTKLIQGDVISIYVNQASGGSVQVGASAGSVYFSGYRVY